MQIPNLSMKLKVHRNLPQKFEYFMCQYLYFNVYLKEFQYFYKFATYETDKHELMLNLITSFSFKTCKMEICTKFWLEQTFSTV